MIDRRKCLFDYLLIYLIFFPPNTVRSKRPSDQEWATFNNKKYVDDKTKRDIQYAMLPIAFRDTIDLWEMDYETMDGPTFLLCLEKLEVKDMKDRKEWDENKEKSEGTNIGKEHPNNNRKIKTDCNRKNVRIRKPSS